VLRAVEDDLARPDRDDVPDAVVTALLALRDLGTEFVRRLNRLEIDGGDLELDGPVLFVANHGFGGVFDVNVFA
jgi:hypothetical protein